MHVQYWSWLVLCVLGNAETIRRSIHCPSLESLATSRFNVHCTRASPCENLDIFCPSTSNTEMLWVDCNGPHACSNVNIYSSVSSIVRCRGRSSACENVNYYCGDMESVLGEPAGSIKDKSGSISCKFQHLATYGTINSFFGCYGDVSECTSTAITDYAYTDNHMYCDTDNTPCVMDCETSASCMNDRLECTTENSHLCQCKSSENCASVIISPPEDLITTEEPQMESTVAGELQAEAKQPVYYYVPIQSNDYLSDMILATNYCNTRRGTSTESYKVICNNAGPNAGEIHYFSDAYCKQPLTSNSDISKYTCMMTSSTTTQIASISRYITLGVNHCANEDTIQTAASERSTYYISLNNCAAYSKVPNMWQQFTCQNGILSHSLYSSSSCQALSLVSSDSYSDGACLVEANGEQMQTQYLQINCSVLEDSMDSSTTTTKIPESSSVATTTTKVNQLSTTTQSATSLTTEDAITITVVDINTTPTTETTILKTTEKETLTTAAETTLASTSVLTTSMSDSTMQEETFSTEKPSIVTTEKSSIVTTQTLDEESTTKSSFASTSQPITTVNMMTTKLSSATNATGQPAAGYQEKSTGTVLKEWQLALLIVLPTIAIAIGCFIVVYSIQRWRKGEEAKHGRLHDEENQLGIYAPPKKIQIGAQTTIETEITMTEEENQHTKCASAQSIDLVLVSPETAPLNTTTTTTEGDEH